PPQVHRFASGRHLRHSGDQPGRPRAGEPGRGDRPVARCGHAPAHGCLRRGALMSEWWTYTISDFLMYSPRTYYRMLERYNHAIWPGQILTLGLGLVMLALLRRPSPRQGRILSGLVALLWGMVGWGFLWRRYASINWAATYFAWAFALELLLFV